MKILTISILIVLTLLGGVIIFTRSQNDKSVPQLSSTPSPTPQEKINITASFKIITNGTTRIFTDPKYHNQSAAVYIQLPDPYTVHISNVGTTWDDFFKTLPMKLTKDCLTTGTGQSFCTGSSGTLRFYLNDKEDQDLLDKEIKDGDKVLIEFISQ